MSKFAVTYMNYFDNVMITKIVEAKTWMEALQTAFGIYECIKEVGDDQTNGQQAAFDQDWNFNVVEIV
jgi:hypothetical protein